MRLDVESGRKDNGSAPDAGARPEGVSRTLSPEEQSAILSQLAEGVIVTDLAGTITFINEAAAKIHGVAELGVGPDEYSATYHLLTDAGQPYPPHDLPLARAVATGQPTAEERWRIRRPDGSVVLAVGSARPLFGSSGERLGTVLTFRDETAREQAELALHQSEARLRDQEAELRLLTDALPVLVSYVDRDQRYRFNNKTYETWFGQPREEVVDKPMREVLGEVTFEGIRPHVEAALSGKAVSFETRVPDRDGGTREVEASYIPRRGPNGAVEGFYVLAADIGERKHLEAQRLFLLSLQEAVNNAGGASEIKRAIGRLIGQQLGCARAGFADVADNGEVVRVEEDWTDGSVPSLAGEARLLDAFGPAVVEELRAGRTLVVSDFLEDERSGPAFAATWESVQTRSLIVVPSLRAGDLRALLYVHEPRPRAWTPQEVEIMEAAAERTMLAIERAQAEAAVRESAERLAATFDNVQIGICETSLDGAIRRANPAFARILGYTPDELAGVRFSDLTHPEHREVDRAGFKAMVAGDLPLYATEKRYLAKDGSTVWASLRSSVVRDEQGTPLYALSTIQDITERKVAEEALRDLNATLERRVAQAVAERERLEEQMLQMQKLQAVGQLAGGVAHDFNNLLAAVVGNLDMLQRKIGTDSPLRRFVDSAMKGADRGAQLTRQLLSFARKQRLSPQPVDANQLIQGTVSNLLSRTLGGLIEIELLPAEDLWPAAIDPTQLESAILNLAVNARDAMPDGGRLTLETSNVRVAPDSHADLEAGDYVLITVTDTGSGMEPDVVARATEPFFTTKPVGQGTGLGLPTVYGFLRQSGGTMRLTSHPGEGTTVQLYLPRSASAPAGERPATGPVQARGSGEIVLVVDDDEGVRTTTASLLAELGYAVIDTEKGERALEILKANPGIKLMVADYAMPGMNGAELIARARQARPELKAIVVTGYAQGSELDRVLPVGAVLRKPFGFADLSEALKHAQ